jgi:hypothetical protein
MLMSKRGVKRYLVKMEGATQKRQFWGQIRGSKLNQGHDLGR